MQDAPPLPSESTDDYHAAEPARKRLAPKHRFLSLPNLRSRSKRPAPTQGATQDDTSQAADSHTLIHLDNSVLDEAEHHDKYEWAILYENQRGMTLFSIPYYSHLSLLPSDPAPFTIPTVSSKRSEQPLVSLSNYPLPDGNWRWVSKSWMIDMRSDSGEVQHDGFEYNWLFRQHNWRAQVGGLSAGGWVRRRRWVRLMMRPAKTQKHHAVDDDTGTSTLTTGSTWGGMRRHSIGTTLPPSIITHGSSDSNYYLSADEVWLGDDAELDWGRCHRLMKQIALDGRKLELWKLWLGHPGGGKGKQMEMEVASASQTWTPTVPKEYIIPVLQAHGDSLLRLFVYPDSRAEFLQILGRAGLVMELNVGLGLSWHASEIDFWSYTSGLAVTC